MRTSIIRSRLIVLTTSLVVVISCAFYSCESFFAGKEKPSKNLTIEDEVEVVSETISPSGGTIVVDDPASEIDGMEIMVPEGSYSNSRTFKITTATITSHNLGEYFNPITPLIQIENGSGYADSIMEITIPISIEDGEIPLGFYYDEITGKLEAIPVKNYTNNSITLLTRHFMPASELRGDNEGLKGIKIDATSNLVISSLAESVLKMKPIISSGFKVGEDDWEFVNFGSYLSPYGHCFGQCFTAMWYYFEKKLKGEEKLFGKYSILKNIQEDNAIGYRFCSVIQNDLDGDGIVNTFFDKYIDKDQTLDYMKLKSVAASMLITGEPQGINIFRKKGIDNKGKPIYGGHALICYQVSLNDGMLYISDPNKPGIGQTIVFKNNKFEPYIAKINGNAASNPYPFITWYAKSAWIEWNKIGNRFKELEDSTIGTIAPNKFPEYTIWVQGKNNLQLEDGYSIDSDSIKLAVEDLATGHSYNIGGKWYFAFNVYDENGNKIDIDKNNKQDVIKLNPGLNRLGIHIYVEYTGAGGYVDFKWFNVYYSKLKIDPDPIVGEPNKDIEITAMSQGTAPKDAKFVWDFGDGTKQVTVQNDSIVKHKFAKEGDYEVVVSMYDNSTNKLVGHAFAEANIANGILSRLQKYQWVEIMFATEEQNTNSEYIDFSVLWVDNSPPWGVKTGYPIKWNGASFSVSYDYQYEDFQGESSFQNGTFNCTMSANGLMVKTFEAHEISSNNVFKTTDYADIIVTDIPYNPDYEYDDYNPRFEIRGSKISSHVASYSQKMVDAESSIVSTTLEYSEDEEGNYIIITFSGEK